MSDDKIAEIRERHTMYPPSRPSSSSRYSFIVAYQDIATLLAEVERQRAEIERLRAQVDAVNLLKAEITLLRKALEPLAQLYLWPDDMGEDMARLIRSDADWSEEANEDADSDVFIKRKYIRAARHALEGKP